MKNRSHRTSLGWIVALGVVVVFGADGCASLGEEPAGDESPPPIDRVVVDHPFFVGNVWKSGEVDDRNFATYWNQVTPENAGKWANVEPRRDRMEWANLDAAYGFAREHGFPFRLHTLVWGRSDPSWILGLDVTEQVVEMEEWFALAAERYPDVDFVDVVNEPLHVEPTTSEALGGWGETGYDWVIRVFEIARAYFPGAVLQANDYGILSSESMTAGYGRLVNLLASRGLADAIGVQAHGLERVPAETVRANLDSLAQAGLPIYITELDVAFADDAAQLERLRELVDIFVENPAVAGVTFWGYREGQTFSRNAYLLRADGSERPALAWLRADGDSR